MAIKEVTVSFFKKLNIQMFENSLSLFKSALHSVKSAIASRICWFFKEKKNVQTDPVVSYTWPF